jgi:glycosyltransferase involved in cell wall biosynthesis
VHTTLFESDVAGRIASLGTSVPVVSSLVNVEYGPEQAAASNIVPWKLRAAQVLDAATARIVVRFHAVSHDVARVMSKRLLIPRERIEVIPRGRDAEELGRRTAERRRRARGELGATDGERLVIAVARHEFQKGLDVLLEAFREVSIRVPGSRLAIAGREGGQTDALRVLSDRFALGDRARFLGSRGDVPELLCAADAFVFPSRWEGLPGAVLEAMALEAPIVASDIPPVREVVGHRDLALLVAPERPDELARAIAETLLHPDEAAARARAARQRFLERFTLDRTAEAMLAFYERAAAAAR